VDDPLAQGHGLGHLLTESALTLAREHGLTAVILLKTTAAEF
jgi:N-acetylglutamate synthase-like GNAT family acetyltransferase